MSRKSARILGYTGALNDKLYKQMIKLGTHTMTKVHRECSGGTERDISLYWEDIVLIPKGKDHFHYDMVVGQIQFLTGYWTKDLNALPGLSNMAACSLKHASLECKRESDSKKEVTAFVVCLLYTSDAADEVCRV